jgi:SnoaL-like polyketide cyclase
LAAEGFELWNTGDETLLKQAIAENFTDHTLPPGQPQGPDGPAFALRRQFRAAVPDETSPIVRPFQNSQSPRRLQSRTRRSSSPFGGIRCCREKRAYVLADNKLALNAGWDEELLALELKELRA